LKINNSLVDFFLFGEHDDESCKNIESPQLIQSIVLFGKRSLPSYTETFQSVNEEDVKTKIDHLNHEKEKILDALSHIQSNTEHIPSIIEMQKKYILMRAKIQHLILIQIMNKLEIEISQNKGCSGNIPELIFNLLNEVPCALLRQSKIRQYVLESIKRQRSNLLFKFHERLDDHLVSSDKLAGVHYTSDSSGAEQWESFISIARDMLLSYALLCMLPAMLTESNRSVIIDQFQQALDDALTPMWGRFHFHLNLSFSDSDTIDEESPQSSQNQLQSVKQQIVWTFKYAKNFIQMLSGLCDRITVSSTFTRLAESIPQLTSTVKSPVISDRKDDNNNSLNEEFRLAGREHVAIKAGKFMKAFVARVLEQHFIPSEQKSTGIDEPAASYNSSFFSQFLEEILELDETLRTTLMNETRQYCSDSVIEVIASQRNLFAKWISIDHTFFLFSLRGLLAKPKNAFAFDFNHHEDSDKAFALTERKHRCYRGVYRLVELLQLACQRYANLTDNAKRRVAEVLLEPLLVTAIGIFLFKIRSDAALLSISMKVKYHTHSAALDSIGELLDSINYFQLSLKQFPHKGFIASSTRMKKRWTALQGEIPKSIIEMSSSYSLLNLLDKAFLSANDVVVVTLQSSHRNNTAINALPEDNLGECVAVARGVAITLANVMSSCWLDTNNKYVEGKHQAN